MEVFTELECRVSMGWVRVCSVYGLSSRPTPTLCPMGWARPTPTLCPPAWKFLLCIKVDNVNVRPGVTTCWKDNPTSAFVLILPWNITQQINIRHHVMSPETGDVILSNKKFERLGGLLGEKVTFSVHKTSFCDVIWFERTVAKRRWLEAWLGKYN